MAALEGDRGPFQLGTYALIFDGAAESPTRVPSNRRWALAKKSEELAHAEFDAEEAGLDEAEPVAIHGDIVLVGEAFGCAQGGAEEGE